MSVATNLLSLLRRKPVANGPAALRAVQRSLQEMATESESRLRERAERLRGQPAAIEAVALVTESVRRTHGLVAHEVQLRAGLALAEGKLVEMATGEGKTLVALLPAFAFALRGRGVHVATVNPYLAERDAEFAGPVFARLGLNVGLLQGNDSPEAKRAGYAADVTYGVGTDFGFDYLRDQLAIRNAGRTEPRYHEIFLRQLPTNPLLLQRSRAFAVIDEADSVLLDEARSPLIITASAPRPSLTPELFRLAAEIAVQLRENTDYTRETDTRRLILTREAERNAMQRLDPVRLSQLRRSWRHYLENALHVQHCLRRDVHYLVSEGRIAIVDEFTGRLCPDRAWRDGLHQAVEAYAGVGITEENLSEATISRPSYFQLYERVCGLSGTLAESAGELRAHYALRTTVIPTHRPCLRTLLPDRVFATRAAKLAAVTQEIVQRHATGQPVLIGTRTIENSEALWEKLAPLGLRVQLLNARQDSEEAKIIAAAGEPGAITIATNMAGRGAHIPVPEESLRVGGLYVLGLERHESGRIDRQLVGRTARQGQPGTAQFFLSLEDDLLLLHAPKLAQLLARQAASDDSLPAHIAGHFRRVQRQVEADHRADRRMVAAHDRWINELKEAL